MNGIWSAASMSIGSGGAATCAGRCSAAVARARAARISALRCRARRAASSTVSGDGRKMFFCADAIVGSSRHTARSDHERGRRRDLMPICLAARSVPVDSQSILARDRRKSCGASSEGRKFCAVQTAACSASMASGNRTVARSQATSVFQPRRSPITEASARAGPSSPCTTYTFFGGRRKPDSQRRISD